MELGDLPLELADAARLVARGDGRGVRGARRRPRVAERGVVDGEELAERGLDARGERRRRDGAEGLEGDALRGVRGVVRPL